MTDAQPMPADPISAARASLADHAQNEAQNYVMRRVRSQLKGYLPRFLWPLIPGERGTVAGALKKDIKKRVWAAITGLIFTLVFFGIVASVLGVTFLYIGWVVFTSL